MSTPAKKIEGSAIRSQLRSRGLPGGTEKVCCGGKVTFSRDYATQLKALGMKGNFKIYERGAHMDTVSIS